MDRRRAFIDFIAAPLDIVVVGGGITGAGILHAAAMAGYRAALIEQRDFAWGSSSRSSKLLHGGLRYLKYGKVALTALALRERDRVMRDYPELSNGLRFYLPYEKNAPWSLRAGIGVYDVLAGRCTRKTIDRLHLQQQFPFLRNEYNGALSYVDGQTDDAQLVWRVLQQAREAGAQACNYFSAQSLSFARTMQSLIAKDEVSGVTYELRARCVINATGAWAAHWLQHHLPSSLQKIKLKPLRGSHLVLPFYRVPLTQAMALMHPVDKRPMFALPWGGEVIFGTTDVEHHDDLQHEPNVSAHEFDYLLEAARRQFPSLNLDVADVINTFSGVRPTVDDGHRKMTEISREHCVAEQPGLITIAGGKLTTFRHMAAHIMRRARRQLGAPLTPAGEKIATGAAPSRARDPLSGLQHDVVHLDDWMLRRTHLGLMSADRGIAALQKWQPVICQHLNWSPSQWHDEQQRYLALVK